MYTVYYQNHKHTLNANSPNHACRKAFRYWLREGKIKRQPDTTHEGGFKGVSVDAPNMKFRSINDVTPRRYQEAQQALWFMRARSRYLSAHTCITTMTLGRERVYRMYSENPNYS